MTSIKPLLQQLENPLTAMPAISSLIDAGPQVVDALIQEIRRTKKTEVKTRIAFVLGKIGDARASEAILYAAQGPNSSYVMVQALRRLQATDALMELFRTTRGHIQQSTLEQMGQMQDPRIIPILQVAAHHPDEHIRWRALSGLFRAAAITDFDDLEPFLQDSAAMIQDAALQIGIKIDRPRTIAWLASELVRGGSLQRSTLLTWLRFKIQDPGLIEPSIRCLSDRDANVRLYALQFLGWQKSPAVFSAALEIVGDESWKVRSAAANCLGQLKNPAGVSALVSLLEDPQKYVRSSSARALGVIRSDDAVSGLQKALPVEKDLEVRGELVRALLDIGTPLAVQAALARPGVHPNQRYFAAQKLARHLAGWRIPTILAQFKNQDDEAQALLARAFGMMQKSEAVDWLVQAAESADPELANEAAEALALIGSLRAKEIIRSLLQRRKLKTWTVRHVFLTFAARRDLFILDEMILALQDVDDWVQASAALALGLLGAEPAVDALIQLVRDGARQFRVHAVQALGRTGAVRAIPTLVEILQTGDNVQLVSHSAWALGELRARQEVPALIRALHVARNNDAGQMEAISEALGKMADPQAVEELIGVLHSELYLAMQKAAWALGRIGDRRAVGPLIELLHRTSQSARPELWGDWYVQGVRMAVIGALGRIHDPVAAQALLPFLADQSAPEWLPTLKALSRIGCPEAAPALVQIFKQSPPPVRKLAGRALAHSGAGVVPMLQDGVHHPDPVLRRCVAWIFGNAGGSEATAALSVMLTDPDWRVRSKAAQALGKIGSEPALVALETALNDPVEQVRFQAAILLSRHVCRRAGNER